MVGGCQLAGASDFLKPGFLKKMQEMIGVVFVGCALPTLRFLAFIGILI